MLVLLAFGTVVILMNLGLIQKTESQYTRPEWWLEVQGEKTVRYRFTRPEQLLMLPESPVEPDLLSGDYMTEKGRALAVTKGKDGEAGPASLSPRLSFFLQQNLPVNSADSAALSLIPGIGPYLANNIIQYRRKNGRIDNKQELTAVPGIGKLRSEKIAPFITYE